MKHIPDLNLHIEGYGFKHFAELFIAYQHDSIDVVSRPSL